MIRVLVLLLSSTVAPGAGTWEAPVEEPLSGIALAVADCESGEILADGTAIEGSYDIYAKNPTSSASGAFQFIDSTWEWVTGLEPPARAYPLEVQEQAFWTLWDDGRGASHWAPSRYCWNTN